HARHTRRKLVPFARCAHHRDPGAAFGDEFECTVPQSRHGVIDNRGRRSLLVDRELAHLPAPTDFELDRREDLLDGHPDCVRITECQRDALWFAAEGDVVERSDEFRTVDVRGHSSPSSCARSTASLRLVTPNFVYTLFACDLTVLREMNMASAIS